MSFHNISASLSKEDMIVIKKGIKAISEKLPFLVNLTPAERMLGTKMGNKSIAFVEEALDVAKQNPTILTGEFKIDDFDQDFKLAKDLDDLLTILSQVVEKVSNTSMAAGMEAFQAALDVYQQVKIASKRIPGMQGIARKLGTRFIKIRSERPDEGDVADDPISNESESV